MRERSSCKSRSPCTDKRGRERGDRNVGVIRNFLRERRRKNEEVERGRGEGVRMEDGEEWGRARFRDHFHDKENISKLRLVNDITADGRQSLEI
jgi:hypothetical protein